MNTKNALQTRDTALQLADLDTLIAAWLDYERTFNQAATTTVTTYKKGLDVFAAWLMDNVQSGLDNGLTSGAVAVPASTVAAFRDDLAGRYAVQTVNLRLTAVRRFYAFLVNTDRIPFSPAAVVKGLKRRRSRTTHKRDALTNGEIVAVLDTCDTGTLRGTRDLAMLSLFAYCGLRAVEVQRANVGDLRTRRDRLTLDVQGKGHVEKDEYVIIPRPHETAIRAWLSARRLRRGLRRDTSDPLFVSVSNSNRGARLTLRAIRGMVKDRYNDAGVVGDAKTTHSFRHSAITYLVRLGVSPVRVQAFARHGSLDTTMGYYHEAARLDDPVEDLIEYEVA